MCHDPLAAVMMFDESLCQFERGRVNVFLRLEQSIGRTDWAVDPVGRHEVDVDVYRFFEHYFSVF